MDIAVAASIRSLTVLTPLLNNEYTNLVKVPLVTADAIFLNHPMANDAAKEALLPVSLDPFQNNALKRRRPRLSSSDPSVRINQQEQNSIESLLHPESNFSQQLGFKRVFLFLAAYLGVGSLCFFLVRNQIKGRKTNGILDAIYFCVVTMTTVGYGDLVPDTVLAKFLSCIFVFTGMALVGFVLSKAVDYIVEKEEILLVKAMHMREKVGPTEILKEAESNRARYKFLSALMLLLVLTVVGTLFLSQVEELNYFDAFYCVCATVTTLGYGDKSFSTEGGRLFAIFWILISTLSLAQLFLYLAELSTERRRRSLINWVLTRKTTISDLEAADLDNDKVVRLQSDKYRASVRDGCSTKMFNGQGYNGSTDGKGIPGSTERARAYD
ncbi:hypothetical protein RJ640_010173 [Escallonia rubra]|uniref:Potassium channel domain-containing protein n=1 Tax=Escallonia rubra TaxID=112253 RepID=A0AA88UKE6_9ASTE|nr:hypothetical protein RJ640_010173 [Escallonia rubra]